MLNAPRGLISLKNIWVTILQNSMTASYGTGDWETSLLAIIATDRTTRVEKMESGWVQHWSYPDLLVVAVCNPNPSPCDSNNAKHF